MDRPLQYMWLIIVMVTLFIKFTSHLMTMKCENRAREGELASQNGSDDFERLKVRYVRFASDGKRLIKLPQAFQSVFDDDDRYEHTTDVNEANVIFFEKLTDFHSHHQSVVPNILRVYYSLCCVDHISCKSKMYSSLLSTLGHRVHDVVPKTMTLTNHTNSARIRAFFTRKDFEPRVIFKSNHQQQRGLQITSLKNVDDVDISEYVVVQELLADPYLIAGRKINLRLYILATCDLDCNLRFYAYEDGFVYYAPGKYVEGSISFDCNVTSGLGDRKIYVKNPLTLKDFERSLEARERRAFRTNKLNCLSTVFGALARASRDAERLKLAMKFTILGVDVAVSSHLDILLLEINKGPDLRFKDGRDGELKRHLVRSTLDLVIHNESHDFIEL